MRQDCPECGAKRSMYRVYAGKPHYRCTACKKEAVYFQVELERDHAYLFHAVLWDIIQDPSTAQDAAIAAFEAAGLDPKTGEAAR